MVRRRYVKGAVLALAVLVLVVEGYLGYLWYQRYYQDRNNPDDAALFFPGNNEAAPPGKPGPQDGGDTLVHRATPGNIVGNGTYIDHPVSNGNPDAVLLVTQVSYPDGTTANAHPTGVWYDENRGRWAIFNQDLAAMPEGIVFNVVALKEAGKNTFVHRASSANTDGENTYIDHPSANAAPDAVLLITPNWNPGGGGPGTYNDHPVGVWYDTSREKWAIRNEDLAPLPVRAAFDVSIRSTVAG